MELSENIRQITYDDLRRMYEENQRDAVECEQVTQSTNRGESYYADDDRPGVGKIQHPRHALYKEALYRDVKTDGFMMGYLHGGIITQGERGYYYRGETEIYEKSGTTLSRGLEKYKSGEDKLLYRLVADMRIAEFEHFIRMFHRTSCWDEKGLTVLAEPLAQHYGLQTDWLDITNDFNTALFFATCYWNRDDKKWYPLTRKQTEEGDETKKFGVLFCAPSWQITMNNACQFDQMNLANDEGMILPIGYQPFMRCHSQYGYGLHMRNSTPLQENSAFERICFRHSEALSKAVYELMDGGRKVYPEEGLDEFQDILDTIAAATSFSEAAFLAAIEKNKVTIQSAAQVGSKRKTGAIWFRK